MIPEPTKAECVRDLANFRDYADDVRRSDLTTFEGNLRQFVRLMRESPLFDRLFATALIPAQFDPWLHTMMTSRDLRWPDDLRAKLFLQNRLLTAIVDGHLDAHRFAYAVFIIEPPETPIDKIIGQIFHPFAREYLKLAEELVRALPAASDSAPKPATSPLPPTMDIFISHASADAELAGALALLLQVGLNLEAKRIRCTSVNGYRFSVGANVDERIKSEVHEARVLVGLITPASVQSSYVLFELGARWGIDRFLAPLLARGAPASSLPGPTAGINALHADSDEEMHQFVRDIAKELELAAPDPAVYTKHLKAVVSLAAIPSGPGTPTATAGKGEVTEPEKKILRLLWDYEDGLGFDGIAHKTGMKRADADFYAHELERRGLVHIPLDFDEEVDATLTQDGKRYLKVNGLV